MRKTGFERTKRGVTEDFVSKPAPDEEESNESQKRRHNCRRGRDLRFASATTYDVQYASESA
jgi:hypothetical protein